MSKKIGLHIGGRRFDVDVSDEFSPYLKENMAKDFNIDGNNDLKLVLQAYVRKSHEIYLMEKEVQGLLDELEKC
jgi:hypothetical protein